MENKQLIPIFLLMITFFQFGESTKCHSCLSSENELCKDKFVGHVAESICEKNMACLKLIIPRSGVPKANARNRNTEDVYVRKCERIDYCHGLEENTVHCSICNQDFCNSAKLVTPSFAVIAFAYVTKLLFF